MIKHTEKSQLDNNQISEWYRDYHSELLAYVIKHFRVDKDVAEDIVQTAFIRTSQQSGIITNPRVYLYRAAHNCAIDNTRKQNTIDSGTQALSHHKEETHTLCPERSASSRQLLELLNNVIWAMPHKRRRLFTLHRLQGLSFAEISRQVGLSESAVRKSVGIALKECKHAMENSNV